jgi:hydrogenase maturation protease
MDKQLSNRIAILGLGNPVLSDDAVGLAVAEELESLIAGNPIPGVDVLTSTRAGFELLDLLTGYDRAIIVDAFQSTDPHPGRIKHLGITDITGNARLNAVHEINLDTALKLAEQLGIPMPAEVEIFAVEVGDVYTLSEKMSDEVAAVVKPLAREIHERAVQIAALLDSKSSQDENPGDEHQKRQPFYTPPE